MPTPEARHRPAKSEPAFDAVAFAASAGGVYALTTILGRLPAEFPAVVLVVQHLDPRHRSLMPEIVGRRSTLPVFQAVDGMRVEPGNVYSRRQTAISWSTATAR